jgi:hypothetical protein
MSDIVKHSSFTYSNRTLTVHNECSYYFYTTKPKVRCATAVVHTPYNECSNFISMDSKVIAKVTALALLVSLGALATHSTQFVFAAPLINPSPHTLKIQDGNSSGWLCGSNCHLVSNSGYSKVQSAYRLTVHILSYLPGASTVRVYVTTKNGYTDQANVATTGIASWTFDIPQNQGNWVQVCSNYCLKYQATGKDMLVSLSPVAYRLTVNVPSHPFGASTVGIFVTTKNGYTDQANVATTGIASWTFDIPQHQGNWVRVCVNSGILSHAYCQWYEATGKDMLVSLSPVAYRLTVNVPSHPFGASTVDIFVTTKNGYTDQANVATTGIASWTFDIPQHQGNSVQVCVNFSPSCHNYKVTGGDMSVAFREALASP